MTLKLMAGPPSVERGPRSRYAAAGAVPAAFLAPRHARITWHEGTWTVESLGPGGQVLFHGGVVQRAAMRPGDVFLLADRVGNFVTVKVPTDVRETPRDGALRAALPEPDGSFLIGSAPRCAVRLDHPLIQARHVAVPGAPRACCGWRTEARPPGRTSMATGYGARNVPAWATSSRSAPTAPASARRR